MQTIYPPFHYCQNPDCERASKGLSLKKEETRRAVLFTLDNGAIPVYSIHLYCTSCHINYHNNFYVKGGQRNYYDYRQCLPDIIQVGEHQFVECRVIESWKILMNVAWSEFPQLSLPDVWLMA